MTREEAWRRTKGYLYDALGGEEADEIIKALEQEPCEIPYQSTSGLLNAITYQEASNLEPCEDCVPRISVIDYLCKHCPDDGECFKDCDEIKHLRQMPSVTPQEPFVNKPCVSSEVCEHDKQKVLDKIRAEIEQITDTMGVSYNQYVSKIDVLQIINKYKAESEPQESEVENGEDK